MERKLMKSAPATATTVVVVLVSLAFSFSTVSSSRNLLAATPDFFIFTPPPPDFPEFHPQIIPPPPKEPSPAPSPEDFSPPQAPSPATAPGDLLPPPAPSPEFVLTLPPKVLDMDGNSLQSGNTYKIMFGNNAGTGLEQNGTLCPPYVAQQRDDTDRKPLNVIIHKLVSPEDEAVSIFKPEEKDTIFEGTPIAVKFTTMGNTTCSEKLVWKVVDEVVGEGDSAKTWGFVKIGGSFDNDGIDVSDESKFELAKADYPLRYSYRFRSCPTIAGDVSCQDIGKLADTVTTRPVLVVDNSDKYPFYIRFNKV